MTLRVPSSTLLLLALLAFGTPAWAAKADVEVCHIPPGNPANFHTITVSENAVQAHLGHGDLLGACFGYCDQLCDDGNPCTVDTCDALTGACAFPPVACPNGQTCNTGTGTCEVTCPCASEPTFAEYLSGQRPIQSCQSSFVSSCEAGIRVLSSDPNETAYSLLCSGQWYCGITPGSPASLISPEQGEICRDLLLQAAANQGVSPCP